MSEDHLPPSIAPRGLNIRQAAAYWGVSLGTYKKLVALGVAPGPMNMRGLDRVVIDRLAIDRAMDAAHSSSQAADLAEDL
jgi:hypothetical protein